MDIKHKYWHQSRTKLYTNYRHKTNLKLHTNIDIRGRQTYTQTQTSEDVQVDALARAHVDRSCHCQGVFTDWPSSVSCRMAAGQFREARGGNKMRWQLSARRPSPRRMEWWTVWRQAPGPTKGVRSTRARACPFMDLSSTLLLAPRMPEPSTACLGVELGEHEASGACWS